MGRWECEGKQAMFDEVLWFCSAVQMRSLAICSHSMHAPALSVLSAFLLCFILPPSYLLNASCFIPTPSCPACLGVQMPWLVEALASLSYVRYSFEALVITEFHGADGFRFTAFHQPGVPEDKVGACVCVWIMARCTRRIRWS